MRGRSTATGKDHLFGYIIRNHPKTIKILEVGFGSGIIGRYLRQFEFDNIDGLDIWPEEMDGLCLENVYNNIFFGDMRDFNYQEHDYDMIIFGDSLEHIPLVDAKNLLESLVEIGTEHIIVSIPYNQPMPSFSDNPHDAHLQGEVNKEYMQVHFPYLTCIFEGEMMDYLNGFIGVYVYSRE